MKFKRNHANLPICYAIPGTNDAFKLTNVTIAFLSLDNVFRDFTKL